MEKKIKSELLFKGNIISLYKDDIIAGNGIPATREYVTHNGGVCILGFIDGKVVMEKQFRYPYQEELYEVPAGKLEKGELPIDAAKREFEEETGYKVDSLISLGEMYPTVAYSNEIIHMFYADKLSKGTRHLDKDESLDIILMDMENILEMIGKNQIKDAKTICLIFKYLNYIKQK